MTKFNEFYEKRMGAMLEETAPDQSAFLKSIAMSKDDRGRVPSTGMKDQFAKGKIIAKRKPTLSHTVKNFIPNVINNTGGFIDGGLDKASKLRLPKIDGIDGGGLGFKGMMKGAWDATKAGVKGLKDEVVGGVKEIPTTLKNTAVGAKDFAHGLATNNPELVNQGGDAMFAPLQAAVDVGKDELKKKTDQFARSADAIGHVVDQGVQGNLVNRRIWDKDAEGEDSALHHAGDVSTDVAPNLGKKELARKTFNIMKNANRAVAQQKRDASAVASR